jgi:hypothetical protein
VSHPAQPAVREPTPGGDRTESPGALAFRARLAAEHAAPVSDDARRLADAIRARHAGAALAVVFYGSCLRTGSVDGVHDFYLVVESYRTAYASGALAVANALLPPNVFYLELPRGDAMLRAKVAVVSREDLARGCAGGTHRSGLWARFAQPVAAVWLRDDAARALVVEGCAEAVETAVLAGLSLGGNAWQPIEAEALWRRVFRATYAAELRPERRGASDALYAAHAARYDAALGAALDALERRGSIDRETSHGATRVRLRSARRALPRPVLAKALAAVALAKSGLTFGEWLPYALWKVERHSGLHLEASPRQRRHPWLFALPLVVRALRSGALR